MRLFLACLLPDAVTRGIASETAPIRAAAPAVRWVPVERLHLTIKFLGERPDHDVPSLQHALAAAASRCRLFDATIEGIGAFPNFSRPRVVWLGMHPLAPFGTLAAALDDAAHGLGYARETRPFRAHVTLGRIGGALPVRQRHALVAAQRHLHAAWSIPVSSVALVRSTLHAGGARYETLTTIPLGGL